jgi:hypothetical protein
MNNELYCETCGVSFVSWKEMKEHLQSVEHRRNANDPLSRSEQLLKRIAEKLLKPEEKNGSKQV